MGGTYIPGRLYFRIFPYISGTYISLVSCKVVCPMCFQIPRRIQNEDNQFEK